MTLEQLQVHLATVARAVAKAIGGGGVGDELLKLADELDPPVEEPVAAPVAAPEPVAAPAPAVT
jgi:hypothetical protein